MDTTLRYLTWAVRSTGAPVSMVGVRTGLNGLELLLSTPARQGAPRFAADESGWQWRLSATTCPRSGASSPTSRPTRPAWSRSGTADDGSTVLVDVEQLGLTSVEGDATVVRAWLNGLALDVATAPWAGDVDLRLVGGLVELASLEQVSSSTWTPSPPRSRGPSRPPAARSACDPRPRPRRGAAGVSRGRP